MIANFKYSHISLATHRLNKLRHQFEVNFFSVFTITQKVLPIMRNQKEGVIVNISSIAGQHALPSAASYSSSKHALEGFTEALMQEVAPFGIRVLLIEPGAFRTEFLSSKNFQTVPASEPYLDNPAGIVLKKYSSSHGTQQGDPKKAANLIVDEIYSPRTIDVKGVKKTLFRLPLGQDCLDRLEAQSNFLNSTIDQLRPTLTSTNH